MSHEALASDWTAYSQDAERRRDVPEVRSPLLDDPSDPNPKLSALMHEKLLRIALTLDGRTARINQVVVSEGGAIPISRVPSSGLRFELEQLDQWYARCQTHRQRLCLIKQAQDIGDRLKFRKVADPAKINGTAEWRRAIAEDPRSCAVVAEDYSTSRETVRRIKNAAGTQSPRGRPRKDTRLEDAG